MSQSEHGDDIQRVGARTTLEGRTMTSEVRPTRLRASVDRRDRVRWGPVWAGTVVALATYLLLELALLAADLLDVESGGGDLPDGLLLTVVAAAVAFLLGGLVAGASFAQRDTQDGILHGLLVWAATTAIFVLLAVFGTGLALGSVGDTVDRVRPGFGGQEETAEEGEEDLEEAAGNAALTLGATAVAAAVGGMLGSKLWPRREQDDVGLRDADSEWRSES